MTQFSPIQVKIGRSSLSIQDCPPELAEKFQYTRMDTTLVEGNFVTTPVPVKYAHLDERTKVCRTFPNALHLVQRHAESLNQTLCVTDLRVREALNLAAIDKEAYRSVCYKALEAVAAKRSSGLVIGPTGVGKTSILCGLAKMAPKHFKVLVTTENRNVVMQIYKALCEAMPDEKIGLHSKPTSIPGRIIVTNLDALKDFTQGDMAYTGYGLRDFDVWICDEVHRLPVPSMMPFLSHFRTAYSWGLTATHVRTDNSHILNEAVFGPILFSVGHKEVLEHQAKTGEKGIVPVKVLVFPLPTEKPITEDMPLSTKVRIAYLRNAKLKMLLQGINSQLPAEAKALIFVDTYRLGVLVRSWLPQYTFVHGRLSQDYRMEKLQKLRDGDIQRVVCTDVWSEGVDVPDLGYVIDCSAKVSPTRIIQRAGRAARNAENKTSGIYVMFLNLESEHLFNQGVEKLKTINDLSWEVQFMFNRETARSLPHGKAALLPELGQFAT